MSSQYIFDKDDIKFRKKRTSVWAVLRRILVFFVATASMAVLYYLVFAFFFSTEEQQRLKDENRMYEKEYPELQKKEQLVSDVIEGLRLPLLLSCNITVLHAEASDVHCPVWNAADSEVQTC